jgi:hypothetical protein
MAQTPQQLVTAAACYDCQIADGIENAVIIYLLNQIAATGMTPQQLVTAASCYDCQIPAGYVGPIMIYLLGQILANGGGGGGGAVQVLNGATLIPGSTPTNTAQPAVYYSTTSHPSFYTWDTNLQSWTQVIVGISP